VLRKDTCFWKSSKFKYPKLTKISVNPSQINDVLRLLRRAAHRDVCEAQSNRVSVDRLSAGRLVNMSNYVVITWIFYSHEGDVSSLSFDDLRILRVSFATVHWKETMNSQWKQWDENWMTLNVHSGFNCYNRLRSFKVVLVWFRKQTDAALRSCVLSWGFVGFMFICYLSTRQLTIIGSPGDVHPVFPPPTWKIDST